MSPNKHDIQIACECGGTLKVSFGIDDRVNDMEKTLLIKAWSRWHSGSGHEERVSLYQARIIRFNGRRVHKSIKE